MNDELEGCWTACEQCRNNSYLPPPHGSINKNCPDCWRATALAYGRKVAEEAIDIATVTACIFNDTGSPDFRTEAMRNRILQRLCARFGVKE